MDQCKDGIHNLIKITDNILYNGAAESVKWCAYCGAVVVDKEVDGRVWPGYYGKMQFPKIILDMVKK